MTPDDRKVRLNWGGIAYSLRRYYVDDFHLRYIPALSTMSLVLDLGGHKSAKRGQFRLDRYPVKAIYLDLGRHYGPDVQADATQVPFRSSCFDAVVCSEVLEHVSDPPRVLREIHHVLKRGGRLFLCVPFLHQVHNDPGDYGRYTDLYWRQKLDEAGFEVFVMERQGLFWSVLMDMVRAYVCERLSGDGIGRRVARFVATRAFIATGKWLAVRLDTSLRARQDAFLANFTTGFGIVGAKR